jgi:hypothetical protein
MTPEDYMKTKGMLSSSSSSTTLQVAQETPTSQEQPVLILKQDDKTLIYLGVIIIGVLAILAITAMLLRRRE